MKKRNALSAQPDRLMRSSGWSRPLPENCC